jgi:two-component system sensor histidine kinase PilS (NtrC family)
MKKSELDLNVMNSMTAERFPSFSLFRLLALSLILITTIFIRQDIFGNEVVSQIYFILTISFFISVVTAVFFEEVKKVKYFVLYQISYDVLLSSYLIFQTGINESIFLFLYILNIIHAAIIFDLAGALSISALSGAIYGAIYFINKDTSNENQFYTLFYNELFYLLTGLLSGQLMEELKRQSILLRTEKSEVERLKLLTDRLINNLPSGIMLVDKDDFVVSYNKSLLTILDKESLAESNFKYYEVVPELEGARARWFSLTEQDKLRFQFNVRAGEKLKNLSLQIVFSNNLGLMGNIDESNSSARAELIFIIQDVSKLRQLEDKLQMDSRLAAVGQLAAGIAHEIRTPLASISGSIETLLKNIKPQNEDDEKLVSISLREIRRLDRLITEFLVFVKPTDSALGKVSLKSIVEEVVISLSNIKNTNVVPKFANNLKETDIVDGDTEKLKQVFINLFMNSIEASVDKNMIITIDSRAEKSNLVLILRDDGPGISSSIRDIIFNPFFTTKKSGTGLGLANVAQIIKRHGGDIRALDSTAGACFEIQFPRVVS